MTDYLSLNIVNIFNGSENFEIKKHVVEQGIENNTNIDKVKITTKEALQLTNVLKTFCKNCCKKKKLNF